MNVKKTIKKIVALGAGATMVGATMMGAMAALEDYPSNWIEDGAFNGKIVVGQDAATSDVLGAIDIAASLQAASTVSTTVDVPGAAGRVTLTGDAVEIGSSSDMLSINEPLGDVKETVDEFDLAALKGGVISTDQGTTAYKQYLRFKAANASALFPTAVIYGENDAPQEQVGDFLFIAEGTEVTTDAFFEWEIEFEEGLESEISTSGSNFELKDLEDEVFNIFGTDFVFVNSVLKNASGNGDLTLEFIAGDVTDVLQEGETKTYTIDGKDYEVTLVFVSNPNSGSVEAKLSVNGELTDALGDGGTDIMSDGLEIGIQEILVSERGGVVEFFLGATKVQFQDTDLSDGDFYNGVEITNEKIEDGFVSIRGQAIGSTGIADGEEFEITSIKYRLTADAITGTTDIYVPEGHGVREFLDEPEGLLSPNFDIRYEGLLQVGENEISIRARGDDEYRARATNRQGNVYDIPYVEIDSSNNFRLGEDGTEDFIFVENASFDSVKDNTSANLSEGHFFIDQRDKFLIWNARDDNWDDQATSHVLEYQSIDTNQKQLTFEDLATGTKTLTYSTDASDGSLVGSGDLIVGGNAYKVYVGDFDDNPIAVDLNGDSNIDGERSKFTTRGGGVIEFGNNTAVPGGSVGHLIWVLHTENSLFSETDEGNEELYINVSKDSNNEVTLAFYGYNRTGVTASGAGVSVVNRESQVFIEGLTGVQTASRYSSFFFDPVEPDDMEDHELEMTDYGVKYDFYNPTGNNPEELTLMYPTSERGVQVFVTAGSVSASSGGSAGGVTSTQVNPIAVGLAVLDVDAPAVGSENLIVVGGPCINSVAAELLGVSYPACGQAAADLGFEPGMAVIKLYEADNAILVAGYEAQDTLGASYVLADYDDYENLEGSEVEVVVADLDTISVNPVQ